MPLSAAMPGLKEGASPAIASRIFYLSIALQQGSLDVQASPDGFTEVEVAFIQVGVTTGNLDGALGCLASLYEADHRTVLRVKRQATYPMMLAFCACWIPTFPIAFFVGPIAWMVVGTLATTAVFSFGGVFLLQYFAWLRGKPRWAQVRYLWALATALEAGLDMDQALSISAQAAAPSELSDCLRYLACKGRPISGLLRKSELFNEGALSLIETGEISGDLPESIRHAARYLEGGTL